MTRGESLRQQVVLIVDREGLDLSLPVPQWRKAEIVKEVYATLGEILSGQSLHNLLRELRHERALTVTNTRPPTGRVVLTQDPERYPVRRLRPKHKGAR